MTTELDSTIAPVSSTTDRVCPEAVPFSAPPAQPSPTSPLQWSMLSGYSGFQSCELAERALLEKLEGRLATSSVVTPAYSELKKWMQTRDPLTAGTLFMSRSDSPASTVRTFFLRHGYVTPCSMAERCGDSRNILGAYGPEITALTMDDMPDEIRHGYVRGGPHSALILTMFPVTMDQAKALYVADFRRTIASRSPGVQARIEGRPVSKVKTPRAASATPVQAAAAPEQSEPEPAPMDPALAAIVLRHARNSYLEQIDYLLSAALGDAPPAPVAAKVSAALTILRDELPAYLAG